MTGEPGLRELKKRKARQHIADVAAHLIGEHGYEQVSVSDVARAAEVSEQTIYNYFSTKHDLVLDRADEIREQLVDLVAGRPDGLTPADALRAAAHVYGERIRHTTSDQLRGELPVISAASKTIRRLLLESRDRTADEMAGALVRTSPGTHPAVARAHAAALVAVFQMIVDHIGFWTLEGLSPNAIADELAPATDAVLDDLARHFTTITQSSRSNS